jgi:hypothetical protein
MNRDPAKRRFDLDWLRIIAFGLLIFYHVGMFYVTWGWHVKSEYASPAAEPFMRLINPWRLALIFFISGVAIRFATDKAGSLWKFAGSRVERLGLPLLFGIYVLVMPQAYFQLRQSGEFTGSMLDFYPDYVSLDQVFSTITPTWNHLWYLAYVLLYILVTLPFLPWLKRFAESRTWHALTSSRIAVAVLLILPFVCIETWLTPRYPTTHALVGDWANHAHRFAIFLVGVLVAKDAGFWRTVNRLTYAAVALAIGNWFVLANGSSVVGWLGQHLSGTATRFVFSYAAILYAWSCMLILFGLGQRFLNRESRLLRYLTSAIFCYYVLHQTITVVAGYYLTQLQLGALPEFLALTAITLGGCALGYEIARRVPWFGVLVGVRQASGFSR